eukprot:2187770-Pyramimonas_sp.AAC.3
MHSSASSNWHAPWCASASMYQSSTTVSLSCSSPDSIRKATSVEESKSSSSFAASKRNSKEGAPSGRGSSTPPDSAPEARGPKQESILITIL